MLVFTPYTPVKYVKKKLVTSFIVNAAKVWDKPKCVLYVCCRHMVVL